MRKNLFLVLLLLASKLAICQNFSQGFVYHPLPGLQGFTEIQIDSLLSRPYLENFRLQDKHTTLKFDNGFEIELLSANEIVRLGLISSAANYQNDFATNYKLPILHLLPDGHIMAAYTSSAKTYKAR